MPALRDRSCNPQLQELRVTNLEYSKLDSKTDSPENFFVTLQTKALKAFPYPNLATVAAIDTHAADAAIERTRFDQQTACNAEQLRFAHEARSTIKDDNSLKNYARIAKG